VYRGTRPSYTDRKLANGVMYRYALSAVDAGGNTSPAAVAAAVPKRIALVRPRAGTAVRPPVRLAWIPKRKATYYNVQVFRLGARDISSGHLGTKILTAWPHRPRLTIPGSWRFEGRPHRLAPGRYRWYVWPGMGRKADERYGKLLGQSTFVVRGG
jgi:hypothetical protein